MTELGMQESGDEDDSEDENSEEEEEEEDIIEEIVDEATLQQLRQEVEEAVNLVEAKPSSEPAVQQFVLGGRNLEGEQNPAPVGSEGEEERGEDGEEGEGEDEIEELGDFNRRFKPFRDGQPRQRQVDFC